ncbi:MT-A70 family methyltransferase, partial [Nitrobacter sp.]|uniref:MT-A70 family methyltransferase n=1 Tax=Nitrobacter sp. TaxID=29420 RepID=UPI001DD72907
MSAEDQPYQVMPPLSADEYAALRDDIAARGVLVPVEYDETGEILDGHHRVQICGELGISQWPRLIRHGLTETEKRQHARRLNLDRRHLDREQRRQLIAEDLRERPEASDRAIAASLGVDHKTVGSVRDGLESTGEIPQSTERQGRDRRTYKIVQFVPATDEEKRGLLVSAKAVRFEAEADGRERRRTLQQALSDETAKLPTGRRFPVLYADPPWHRKQGVTGRSYENHYPTMSWDDICALPIKDLLLPDAWVFLWIPRAHMFALHAVDMEFATDDGVVITRKVLLPLAWAVARAWGCDGYSTAWVWTKTDEEHPEDQGGGVIAYDQDEILLLFKRGRGLPKPATDEKFGSNHRERSKPLGHSRKPEFYREMIATMCGGLPVMELFARVDAEHPLPDNWHAWGNEAPAQDSLAKADAEIVATEGAQAPAAEGVNSAASRLAGGRTPAPAEDDVVAASSSADQFSDTPGCTASSEGNAAMLPVASPTLSADDGLDLPACLRRSNSDSGVESKTGGASRCPLEHASGTASQDKPAEATGNDALADIAQAVKPAQPAVSYDRISEQPETAYSTDRQIAGVASSLSEPDEFTILKAFSSFATPDRFTIIGPYAVDYIARGLVFKYGGVTDWGLTAAGYDRLDELKRARAGLASKVLTPPAVSDLSDDERDMREVLAAVAGAYRSDLSVTSRTAYERDLIGLGFLSVIDDCGGLAVTDAGHAWLRE